MSLWSKFLNLFKSKADIKKIEDAMVKTIMPTLREIIPELDKAKDVMAIKISKEQKNLLRANITQDTLDLLTERKLINLEASKSPTEIFFHFFGMNENWPIGRNLIGGAMVHSPEYPTYFIPAFTQAKATGDAGELKKGEGVRGTITGGLEGVAVGALVSGKILKPMEMVPYILLGAGLQYLSSKFFPWLGEKMGRAIYLKNQKMNSSSAETKLCSDTTVNTQMPLNKVAQPSNIAPSLKGRPVYTMPKQGNLLKI